MAEIPMAQAETPFVLTFDVGTSSARALLYDARARSIEGMLAQIPHEMETTADGGVFTDADELVERTSQVIDAVLKKAGARADAISGVASDTFWHNVLGVDRDGKAVTPLYIWADTRSERAAIQLRHEVDEEAVHQRTGCMLHPMYLPAKLRWLSEDEPERFKRGAYWMSFAEYFALRCFGTRACSLSMASGSGLLNLNEKRWDRDIIAALPIDAEQLSPLIDVGEPYRGLAGEYARRWPALKDVPWYPSLGDGAASNLGSGGVTGSQIAVNVGTSTAMRVVMRASRVNVPRGLWAYRVDGEHIIVGGAESNGGNVRAWFQDRFKVEADDALARAVAAVPPDGHGLTVLPFLAGERSPNYNGAARGAVTGLSLDTTPAEVLRAFIEAICYRLGLMYRILAESYPQAEHIIGSGAALLQNPTMCQILADVIGKPLVVSEEAEATSRGAALIALEQLRAIPSWEGMPAAFGETMEPDMAAHRVYQAAIERQERLYRAVVPPRE
jgi:gluconokinase